MKQNKSKQIYQQVNEEDCLSHGKKHHQKLKPYLVLQFLLYQSDIDNPVSAAGIIGYLNERCRIAAERRSIYRDIEEIDLVNVMIEYDCDFEEAAEMLDEDEDLRLVVYNENKKGFYVNLTSL